MTPKLYIFARKIHRLIVLVSVVLSLVMMVTGLNMNYGWFFMKRGFAGEIHEILSPIYAVVLTISVITGFYMYLYTLPKKNSGKPGAKL